MAEQCKPQILDIQIVDMEQPDPDDGSLLGTCYILGVPHHAQFVRVAWDDENRQIAVKDPYDKYEDMQNLYCCARYQTVEVPGFPGEYVILIHPFGD